MAEKMHFYGRLPVCFFLLIITSVFAGASPDKRWYYLETPGFEIIFQKGLEADARHVADLLEYTVDAVYGDVNGEKLKRRRWKVVLSTYAFEANGYVTLAPRMSHWYELPSSGLSSLEWYAMLASHETRHMAQFDDMNRGYAVFLSALLGNYGAAAGLSFAVPRWYLEGDAVLTETMLSESGRGRSGAFSPGYKGVILGTRESLQKSEAGEEPATPTYYQMLHRSYTNWLPSRYVLGYHLVNYIRREYGDDAWNRIIRSSLANPPIIGFAMAVRSETGKSLKYLYEEMNNYLAQLWSGQMDILGRMELAEWKTVVPSEESYTRYLSLYKDDTSGMLAVMNDLDSGTRLVSLQETTHRVQEILGGVHFQGNMSFSGRRAVWAEKKKDPLLPHTASGEIFLFDFDSRSQHMITRKGRYHDAAISPDGQTITALSFSHNRQSSVHLFRLEGNEWILSDEIPLDTGDAALCLEAVQKPGNDISFTVTVKNSCGIRLMELSLGETGFEWQTILEPVNGIMGRCVSDGRQYLAEGDINGIQGIWRVEAGKLRLLSAGVYGASTPLLHNGLLYFTNYTGPGGDEISVIDISSVEGVALEDCPDFSTDFLYAHDEAGDWRETAKPFSRDSLSAMPKREWTVKPYPLFRRMTNYHSWIPSFTLEDNTLSLSLYSDDILGTTTMNSWAMYSLDSENWSAGHSVSFPGIFPQITAGITSEGGDLESADSVDASLAASFPYSSTRRNLCTFVSPSVAFHISAANGSTDFPFAYSMTTGSLYRKGFKSYQPEFGVSASAHYMHVPFGDDNEYAWGGGLNLFLPGGFPHGGLRFTSSISYQTPYFRYARPYIPGYAQTAAPCVSTAGITWDFPVAYPDFSLAGILYIRRLRLASHFYSGWRSLDAELPHFSETPTEYSAVFGLTSDLSTFHFEFLEFSVFTGSGYRFDSFDHVGSGKWFPYITISMSVIN